MHSSYLFQCNDLYHIYLVMVNVTTCCYDNTSSSLMRTLVKVSRLISGFSYKGDTALGEKDQRERIWGRREFKSVRFVLCDQTVCCDTLICMALIKVTFPHCCLATHPPFSLIIQLRSFSPSHCLSLSRAPSSETSCWQSWSMPKTPATSLTNLPNSRWHTLSHVYTQTPRRAFNRRSVLSIIALPVLSHMGFMCVNRF